MLTPTEVREVLARAKPVYTRERTRADRIDAYLHGSHDGPYRPRQVGSEYRRLMERSVANMLPLVVDVAAQNLHVDGYRGSGSADLRWGIWQSNGLDRRQAGVHRAALGYGLAYVLVLPGDPVPVLRGVSPRRMVALYDDPDADEWPTYAVRVDPVDERTLRLRVYDSTHVHTLRAGLEWRDPVHEADAEHGAGVCPVVRFADGLDLEGRALGQVEPLIALQDRLDQTLFDMLMVQTYASWRVRTVSGLALPDDATEATAQALKLSADRFLVSDDPDTRFSDLPASDLAPFIDAVELAVRQIATVSQTPPHYLLGQMANLSAEALAAAEAGLTRKVGALQTGFGESWEQVLGLAGALAGATPEEGDERSQVVWRDTESRSLSQVADALGKLAQMLQVPPQALWDRIPGVTQDDVERWKLMVDGDPMTALLAELSRQDAPVTTPGAVA